MTTEHSASGDLDRSLALLWEMDHRPTRGPKPALTLERIVTAAITIADAEGLAGLSMRRVASELGVGTMSLYRYVPGKGELLDLMIDRINEAPRGDAGELGWRGVLEQMARETWEVCLAHPWFLQIDQARPLLGPRALAGLEHVLRGLRDTSLTDQQKVMAMSSVYAFVTGVARDHVNAMQATARTGMTDAEFWAAQEPVLVKAMGTGDYPTIAGMAEDTFSFSAEDALEFGLRSILDGIAGFVDPPTNDRSTT